MKNIILIVAGIVALIVVYYLSPTSKQQSNLRLSEKPDFFMTEFTQHNTNEKGIIDQKLTGEKIDIYDKKNYSLVKSPSVIVTKKDGLEITLNSANGQMFNRNKFFLSGGVKIKNNLDKSVETLITEELWLYPNISFAETDKPITIQRDLSTTKGTGAKFHIDINSIELLSDTTTIYNVK